MDSVDDPDLVRDGDDRAPEPAQPAAGEPAAAKPEADQPAAVVAEPEPAAPKPVEPEPRSAAAQEWSAEKPDAAARRRGRLLAASAARLGGVGRGRWIERGVAVVLLAAAVGTSVHFYLRDRDRRLLDEAHQSAQDAACAYAPVLATYDAKTFNDYVNHALAGATGAFRSEFSDASKSLAQVMDSADVSSKGTDANCELKSGDLDHAEVDVVVNQTIVAAGTRGKPVNGQLTMVMSLQRSNGKWLVGNLKMPQQPPQQ